MKRSVQIGLSRSAVALVAAASLLAGCGGGGGSSGTVPSQQPTAAPTSAPLYPTVNLVITFPYGSKTSAHARTPQYISQNTATFQTLINTVNGAAPPAGFPTNTTRALTYGPGNTCQVSAGTATCTMAIPAPPGLVNYTFNALDGSNHLLSTLTTDENISKGSNNSLSVTLLGVVSTVTVFGATLNANDTSHAGTGETLTVTAYDASGTAIVGSANFANPITLTDNNPTKTATSGDTTQLSVNGGTAAKTVVMSNPADVVTLLYTGQAINPFTITASGTGISGTSTISTTVDDISLGSMLLDDVAHGGISSDPNYGQQTLFFYAPLSNAQTVSATELGYTNFGQKFIVDMGDGTNNTCGTTGSIAAVASPTTPATSFTVAPGSNPGICSVRLLETGTHYNSGNTPPEDAGYPLTGHTANTTGNATHDGTFWISVTASDVSVNGNRRHR